MIFYLIYKNSMLESLNSYNYFFIDIIYKNNFLDYYERNYERKRNLRRRN